MDGLDLQSRVSEHGRHAGREWLVLIGLALLPAHEQKRRSIVIRIKNPGETVDVDIPLRLQSIGPYFVRFEESTHPVIIALLDRIVHVIVTAGTIERHSQERLAQVLDGVVQPDIAIEAIPIAGQVTGCSQRGRIGGRKLVAGQHVDNHAIIAAVGIERFDDPIAPVPDVRLAIAHFLAIAGPIGVAPYVHPMAGPALSILRPRKQGFDNALVSVRRLIGQKRAQVGASGG